MRRLQANGTIIVYARSGTGPPIVLMHGAEADHSMFATLVVQLEKRVTVIACDQRASGDTCNPDEPYTLEDTGDDAAALIEGLGFEKAHVYATSLGRLSAQSLAVRHPERVDRLVLAAAIRIGRTLAEIAQETAKRLFELRVEQARNAQDIARIFYPEAHPAAHPEAVELFKLHRPTPEQVQRRAALLGPAPFLTCPASPPRRWCSPGVRTAWFRALTCCRLPKKFSALSVLEDVRARQCNPGPRVGRAGDLSVSGGGPTVSN
jgi:pimeloyl-ACP methyl ester carboxylesterase